MSWLECPICYGKFQKAGFAKYCPDCRENRKDEIEAYQEEQKALKEMQKRPTENNHEEIVAEIEAYNKLHGTKLSYGQYTAMVDGCGKLDKKIPFGYVSHDELKGD